MAVNVVLDGFERGGEFLRTGEKFGHKKDLPFQQTEYQMGETEK